MAGQGSALATTAAYVLAGELAKASGKHVAAFNRYEELLRGFIESKQKGAERFSAAFAPRTRFGLFLRNQVIRALRHPWSSEVRLEPGHHGHPQASRLFLAGAGSSGLMIQQRAACQPLNARAIFTHAPIISHPSRQG